MEKSEIINRLNIINTRLHESTARADKKVRYEAFCLINELVHELGEPLRLNTVWCTVHEMSINTIDKDDNECTCGIAKHHYHCHKCGGLHQIG